MPPKEDEQLAKLQALELVVPGPEFTIPPEYFTINHLDDDNIRWHLAETPNHQVHIATLLADCEYYYNTFDQAATTRGAAIYLHTKSKPFRRWMAKLRSYADVDCTDEVCDRVSKVDYLYCQYRQCALQWRRHRDQLRGAMAAFETKKTFLASLCGMRRAELEAISARERNVLPE